MKPELVLCLGNELLSDDGFGPAVAEILRQRIGERDDLEIIFAPLAGFALLDLLHGRSRVLIVDSATTEKDPPGTIRLNQDGLSTPAKNLVGSHQISLPTALALGSAMGLNMPDRIDILTVEAKEVCALSESLTPPVAAAVEPAVEVICEWIARQGEETFHGSDRTSAVAVA